MMLNVSLTVRPGAPNSHAKIWEGFANLVIKKIPPGYVAILWGKFAQAYMGKIKKGGGKVIASAHPSPYSAGSGFFGSKPFSRCNRLLIEMKKEPVDWSL
jgi:uracil-DNA glycosylase